MGWKSLKVQGCGFEGCFPPAAAKTPFLLGRTVIGMSCWMQQLVRQAGAGRARDTPPFAFRGSVLPRERRNGPVRVRARGGGSGGCQSWRGAGPGASPWRLIAGCRWRPIPRCDLGKNGVKGREPGLLPRGQGYLRLNLCFFYFFPFQVTNQVSEDSGALNASRHLLHAAQGNLLGISGCSGLCMLFLLVLGVGGTPLDPWRWSCPLSRKRSCMHHL